MGQLSLLPRFQIHQVVFYLQGDVEKYGTGFIRIRKQLLGYPELTLTFEALGSFIRSTIQIKQVDPQKSSEKSSEKIIRLLLNNPEITIDELSRQLQISTRAIEKQITVLKEKERIKRIGSNKGGHWEVKDR